MRIIKIEAIPIELKLKEPFSISNETIEVADNIIIRLETDEELVGWGCAAPDIVTSETKKTVLTNFNMAKKTLIGADPTRINLLNSIMEENLKGNPSLKAGINIALYDILGKKSNMPLFRLLGGYREKILTSVTIGLNPTELMVEKAKKIESEGFKSIKIKCGFNINQDIINITSIHEAIGKKVRIRLDANEGYSVEDALKLVKTLEKEDITIEIFEQPTKANYLYSLKDVTNQCSVPIMADETALTLRDNIKLVRLEIADMINIKLMKIGGISNAIKANIITEIAQVPIMVGCMNESMAAMSAGVHFACGFKNVQYADLDSVLDFDNDVAKGGARYEEGYIIPSEKPGLGVEVQI